MMVSEYMAAGTVRAATRIFLCAVLLFSGQVMAAAETDSATPAQHQTTLLDLWFKLQASGPVYAPYAYIRHRDTQAAQGSRKKALLEEIDNLIWRLEAAGGSQLAAALGQWRRRIEEADDYRTPGQWGPAALLSNPRNGVPVSAIAAIGACEVPGWIEVWSARGTQRIFWESGMRLSTLLSEGSVLYGVNADHVTLVTPYGRTVRRGIAGWNFHDAPLTPGMRIVVPLPLGGQASAWIEKTLSEFLAHVLPADSCRQMNLQYEPPNAGD